MEKTLLINGKNITFRKSGATMLVYKRQTGREFLSDLSAFLNCYKKDGNGNFIVGKDGKPEIEINKSLFDFEYMYDIVHIMAWQANKSIPSDALEWFDQFDEFPILQVFIDLLPMLTAEMSTDEKNALAVAVQNNQTVKN